MNEHMQQLEMVLTKLAAKLNEFKGQLAANDEKWRTVKDLFANFNNRLVDVEKRLESLPVDRMADIDELDAVVKAMRAELDEQRRQAAEKPKRTRSKKAASIMTKTVDMDDVQRIEAMQPEVYGNPEPLKSIDWKNIYVEGIHINTPIINLVRSTLASGYDTAYSVSQQTGIPEEAAQYVMDMSEEGLKAIMEATAATD
jgi:hypothetical protein